MEVTGRTTWTTRQVFGVLLLAYMAFVVYGSLVPIHVRQLPLEKAVGVFVDAFSRPVRWEHRSDLLANVMLFVPLTFLAMGAVGGGQSRGRQWVWAAGILVAAGVFGGLIEFVQVFFPARNVAINDVAAEMTGGLLGVMTWFRWSDWLTRATAALWSKHVRGNWAIQVLLGYVVVLVFWKIQPLDLTISPVELYHKYQWGDIRIVPFYYPVDLQVGRLLAKAGWLVPVGLLLALGRPGRRGSLWAAAGGGLAVAGLIEFFHLFIESRDCSMTDVLVGTAGAMAGGMVARVLGRRGKEKTE